jgi:hypothetical protein
VQAASAMAYERIANREAKSSFLRKESVCFICRRWRFRRTSEETPPRREFAVDRYAHNFILPYVVDETETTK